MAILARPRVLLNCKRSNQAGALPPSDGLFNPSATAATDVESTSPNLEEEGQMRKYSPFFAAALVAGLAVPAYAQTGNGAPSGSHYTLNIIGMAKEKRADMTGSHRHTIFVDLNFSDATPTDPTPIAELNRKNKIFLQEGPFQVLDGNAWDGALFQLPPPDCDTLTVATVDGCDYAVYVRGLGSPQGNPSADITTCQSGDFDNDGDTEFQCSTETVHVERNRGKSTFQNVTKQLLTLCLDTVLDDVVACDTRVQLFDNDFYQYFWDYDNNGLRLAQLRFYPTPDGQ